MDCVEISNDDLYELITLIPELRTKCKYIIHRLNTLD